MWCESYAGWWQVCRVLNFKVFSTSSYCCELRRFLFPAPWCLCSKFWKVLIRSKLDTFGSNSVCTVGCFVYWMFHSKSGISFFWVGPKFHPFSPLLTPSTPWVFLGSPRRGGVAFWPHSGCWGGWKLVTPCCFAGFYRQGLWVKHGQLPKR